MFNLVLYSDYQFNTGPKAAALFDLLKEAGENFAPVRYDVKEPVRKAFPADDPREPVKLLSGSPRHKAGGLLLRGARFGFEAHFKWSEGEVKAWRLSLGDDFFDVPARRDAFLDFVVRLCQKFPVLYGGGAPAEDWEAKHWLVTKSNGGETRRKRGLDIEECLPGVYWLTVFGGPLVKFFGREKLEHLPAHRVLDLGRGGLALALREHPFEPRDASERLAGDAEVVSRLGRQYYFDIENPQKGCEAIPGVTRGRAGAEEPGRAGPPPPATGRPDAAGAEAPDEFLNQTLLSPDGEPYSDPSELSASFVTFIHTKVREVFQPTEAALAALDKYFAAHPQRREYSREHLLQEFVPALGGFLGEVLVKNLGGEWVAREPLPQSAVKIGGKEVSPFRAAYRVVFGDAKLVDEFREAVGAQAKRPARGVRRPGRKD